MPPCPGIVVPLSFTIATLFRKLSAVSPSTPAVDIYIYFTINEIQQTSDKPSSGTIHMSRKGIKHKTDTKFRK